MQKMATALVAGALALGAGLQPALAGDLEAYCVAYAAENDGDPSGCSCLAESASAEVSEELMGVQSEADIDALSDDAKAAINACWLQ